ncbi:MAG: DUF4333 domain-containing protein, partial [Actinomycetota bacterium]
MVRKTLCFAVVVAVLLPACSKTLEGGDIEKQVAGDVKDQNGVDVEVVCPDDIEAKEGGAFTCTATDDQGQEVPIDVEQTDAEGNVTWQMDILNLPEVEASLAPDVSAQVGADIQIDCPPELVLTEPGNTIDCQATDADGGEGILRVT